MEREGARRAPCLESAGGPSDPIFLLQGGRITISPPSALIDACYERLVLLIAGSALEAATADIIASPDSGPGRTGVPEGLIIGAVASRRARGDRIELWLGGAKPREPAPSGWVEILKECLATELDMPEVRPRSPLPFWQLLT